MLPLAAVAALASVAAVEVSGSIHVRLEQGRQPAAGVRVTARPEGGGPPVAAAWTDAQGRFALGDLPRTRLTVMPLKPGWIARAIEGGDSALVIDAGTGEAVSGADFDLIAGGVVTGRITDAWNEPRPRVNVALYRTAGGANAPAAAGRSDDRGCYRLFGLEPGRYILQARPAERLGDEPAVLYYPGVSDPSRARELEVKAGAEVAGIDVVLRPEPVYRISGRLAGVSAGSGRLVVAALRLAEGPEPPATAAGQVAADGSFSLGGLRAGAYLVTAGEQPKEGGTPRRLGREIIDLQADVTGVVLRSIPAGRLEGRVILSGGSSARPLPASVRLRFRELGSRAAAFADAKAPEYRFATDELWPGTYHLEVAAPAGVYLRRIRPGPEGGAEAAVPEGGAASVVVEAGVDPGAVTGMVKAPGTKRGLPHARVALAGMGARKGVLLAAQTDQNGRFVIPAVVPGEYRIRAWIRAEQAHPEDPQCWEQPAARRFLVEPNGEIELELSAAP